MSEQLSLPFDYTPMTRQQRIKRIIARHAQESGVSVAAILGASRESRIVDVRCAAIQEIRLKFNLSYVKIGEVFHRHHTTIMNALQVRSATRTTERKRLQKFLDEGLTVRQIALILGQSYDTVYARVWRRKRWTISP